MWGVAGLLSQTSNHGIEQAVRKMADTLLHRGPDDVGVWIDEAAEIALRHRRLSLLALWSCVQWGRLTDGIESNVTR